MNALSSARFFLLYEHKLSTRRVVCLHVRSRRAIVPLEFIQRYCESGAPTTFGPILR